MTHQVDDLVKTLQTNYDEWEAAKAAEKLGQLRAREAVPALIVALHSQDLLKAWNALDTTTKIAFGGVGEGIMAIITLRCAAAEALGKIGDEKAVPELLTVLNTNPKNNLPIRQLNALGVGQLLGMLAQALALALVANGGFMSGPGPQSAGLIPSRGNTTPVDGRKEA